MRLLGGLQLRELREHRFATAGVYNANVTYAGTQSFNNSGNIYPVLPSAGAFAATNVSTAIPTTFTPNQVVLQPTPRTSPIIVPPYYLVGDSLNAYATLTVAATGAPAPNVVVLFTDSALLTAWEALGEWKAAGHAQSLQWQTSSLQWKLPGNEVEACDTLTVAAAGHTSIVLLSAAL